MTANETEQTEPNMLNTYIRTTEQTYIRTTYRCQEDSDFHRRQKKHESKKPCTKRDW